MGRSEGPGRAAPYRWVALALTALVNVPVQTLWIAYGPITPQAARYYGVGDYSVVQLSMLFMVVYVFASVPASRFVDTRGVRAAVGLGALVIGVCGLVRGLAGPHYAVACAATVGIALGQPLVLNAWTAMPAHWFPPTERASAVGITTVASLAGVAIGQVLPPALLGGLGIGGMQTLFGAVALAVAVLYVLAYRDGPGGADERALVTDGLRHALGMPPFRLLLACTLACMGAFNALTVLTAEIVAPRGLDATQAGTVGAALLGGGVVGALVLPALSDHRGRRVPFIAGGMVAGGLGVVALALVGGAVAVHVVAAVVGACLVPLLPIAMEYAAELVHPTPDGTSNGIMQVAGQASVVVVGLVWLLRDGGGSLTRGLLLLAALLGAGGLAAARWLPDTGGRRADRA